MTFVDYFTVLSSAIIAVIGALLVSNAFRAYLRTERRTMAYLSGGFSLIVIAAMVAGIEVLYSSVGVTFEILALQTSITAVGYVLVTFGIMSHRPLAANQ